MKLKYVTKEFKESQKLKQPAIVGHNIDDWAKWIGNHFNLPARYHKSIQHIQQVNGNTKDYTTFTTELDTDFIKEHKDNVMEFIWEELGPKILRASREGAKEWHDAQHF